MLAQYLVKLALGQDLNLVDLGGPITGSFHDRFAVMDERHRFVSVDQPLYDSAAAVDFCHHHPGRH